MNVDPESSELSAPVPARRKLIRGAFALPMVASVHSGSALANSSNMRCLEKQDSAVPSVTQIRDNYLRVELTVQAATGGQPPTYYVSGSTVRTLGFTLSTSYSGRLAADQFQLFDVVGNMEIGLAFTPSVTSSGGSTTTGTQSASRFNATSGSQGPIGFFESPRLSSVTGSTSTTSVYEPASGYFAALRFDDVGNLTGVGQGSASESTMTGSCWSSMIGANPA